MTNFQKAIKELKNLLDEVHCEDTGYQCEECDYMHICTIFTELDQNRKLIEWVAKDWSDEG